jgi:hypothetical protein
MCVVLQFLPQYWPSVTICIVMSVGSGLQPKIPGVGSLTREDVLSQYAHTVRQLSLQLHLHRACAVQQQGLEGSSQRHSWQEGSWRNEPLQELKATLLQHFQKMSSLSQVGRADLVLCL